MRSERGFAPVTFAYCVTGRAESRLARLQMERAGASVPGRGAAAGAGAKAGPFLMRTSPFSALSTIFDAPEPIWNVEPACSRLSLTRCNAENRCRRLGCAPDPWPRRWRGSVTLRCRTLQVLSRPFRVAPGPGSMRSRPSRSSEIASLRSLVQVESTLGCVTTRTCPCGYRDPAVHGGR